MISFCQRFDTRHTTYQDTSVTLSIPIESDLFIAYSAKINYDRLNNSAHANIECIGFTNNTVSFFVGSSFNYGPTGIAVFLIGL